MNLTVQRIDQYQFCDREFSTVISLPDHISFHDANVKLPIKVELMYEKYPSKDIYDLSIHDNLEPISSVSITDIVEVLSNGGIDGSKMGLVKMKFRQVSAQHDNRRFVLRFETQLHDSHHINLVAPMMKMVGYSGYITVVNYRLKILEEYIGHNRYVWLKDVGGKDKCIDLTICLVDADDNVVDTNNPTFAGIAHYDTGSGTGGTGTDSNGRHSMFQLWLDVELCYHHGGRVPVQDILQLSPDSQLHITHNSYGRIKCRINEVSSRHQGQAFQIIVRPRVLNNNNFGNLHGSNTDHRAAVQPSTVQSDVQRIHRIHRIHRYAGADIAAARSVPVEVKSKVNYNQNKRKLSALTTLTTHTNHTSEGSGGSAATVNGNNEVDRFSYGHYATRSTDSLVGPPIGKPSVAAIDTSGANTRDGGGEKVDTLLPVVPSGVEQIPSSYSASSSSTSSAGCTTSAAYYPEGTTINTRNISTNATADSAVAALVALPTSALPKRISHTSTSANAHAHAHTSETATITPATMSTATAAAAHAVTAAAIGNSTNADRRDAQQAFRDLTRWLETVYAALGDMQWIPIGTLVENVNPETLLTVPSAATDNSSSSSATLTQPSPSAIPTVPQPRVGSTPVANAQTPAGQTLYRMQNPNPLIQQLLLGYQRKVQKSIAIIDDALKLPSESPQPLQHLSLTQQK